MIRVHFTAADFARVRFASRPAPLQVLNTALMMMCGREDDLLFGRWRRRLFRSLPVSVAPLGDLVPAREPPLFLDVLSDTLTDGLDVLRASPPDLVRSEIERVYGASAAPAPPWIRDLYRGDDQAWQLLCRAQHAAFESVVRPVWSLVQDLHQGEFTRHALVVAEHGIGAALTAAVPGSLLREEVWEFAGPRSRDVRLCGRGVVLLPTFHWTGHPLVADVPDGPLAVTYPAGPGMPLPLDDAGEHDQALAGVLGRTRLEILLLLAAECTTGGLARRLGVSNATVSAHTAALRGAGLITTIRAGRSVLHRRTALGSLLVKRRSGVRNQEV